jgi:hypothetical protein
MSRGAVYSVAFEEPGRYPLRLRLPPRHGRQRHGDGLGVPGERPSQAASTAACSNRTR